MKNSLLKYRKTRGLTQPELGKLLGVTFPMISKWERNLILIKAERVKTISKITGIPTAELRPDLY